MEFKFKTGMNLPKFQLGFLSLGILFGIASVLFGEIFAAFCAPCLALVLLAEIERGGKKIYTVVLCAASAVITVLLAVFKFYTATPILCVGAALIIAYLFVRSVSKGEIAFILTAFFAVCIVLNLWFVLAEASGSFSFSEIGEYLYEVYDVVKDTISDTYAEMSGMLVDESANISSVFTEEYLLLALDSALKLSLAVLVILAFLLTGIALKMFSAFLFRYAKHPRKTFLWRFATSSLIAYFYVALFVLSIFTGSLNSVFAVTVQNLFYIFLAVYAYIGYNFAMSVLVHKSSSFIAHVAVIGAILVFGVIALELLSVLGVIFTRMSNKITITVLDSPDDEDNKNGKDDKNDSN